MEEQWNTLIIRVSELSIERCPVSAVEPEPTHLPTNWPTRQLVNLLIDHQLTAADY